MYILGILFWAKKKSAFEYTFLYFNTYWSF